MPKIVKLALFALVPLIVVAGGAYGLAKIGVLPVQKMAAHKPALRTVLNLIGLRGPKTPVAANAIAAGSAPAPDPLAGPKRILKAQQDALAEERKAWESQKQAEQKAKAAPSTPASAPPDPKSIARLATVYEQMPPETVTKIFARLPDEQVLALLRKMDEKQVAAILALAAPERAARLTLTLSRPNPADNPTPNTSARL